MSRQIPRDRPLTDDERAYLRMRGEDSRIVTQDQQFPPVQETDEDLEEGDEYDQWTVADLQAEIKSRNDDGAEIVPASQKKADLIAALRDHDASVEDEQ